MEEINEHTKCPHCKVELDDDDGVFFSKDADTKKCSYCENTVTYVKQFKRDWGNPYCDYIWDRTYMKWEYDI